MLQRHASVSVRNFYIVAFSHCRLNEMWWFGTTRNTRLSQCLPSLQKIVLLPDIGAGILSSTPRTHRNSSSRKTHWTGDTKCINCWRRYRDRVWFGENVFVIAQDTYYVAPCGPYIKYVVVERAREFGV